MEYDFNYSGGATPWPMVWTIEPDKYNAEATLGRDRINFQVQAVPDPDYPDAWSDNFLPDTPPGPGQPAPVAPPLPPKPVFQGYEVLNDPDNDPQDFTSEFYTVDDNNGLVINDVDIRILFPYESIKYKKNGETKTADTPQDALDDGFDFVIEFIPDQRESLDKKMVLKAKSTSKNDLNGTFWFLLNNNWNEARDFLKDFTELSKQHFEEVGNDLPAGGEAESPNENGGSEKELDPKRPEKKDKKTFKEETGRSYDEFIRQEEPENINSIIEEKGKDNFLEQLKKESRQNTEPSLDNPLFNEGENPDEVLRKNTITDLIDRYNLTSQEVLNFLKNM